LLFSIAAVSLIAQRPAPLLQPVLHLAGLPQARLRIDVRDGVLQAAEPGSSGDRRGLRLLDLLNQRSSALFSNGELSCAIGVNVPAWPRSVARHDAKGR